MYFPAPPNFEYGELKPVVNKPMSLNCMNFDILSRTSQSKFSQSKALKMAESKGSLLAKSVQKHLGRSKEKVSPN